jgi:hypothetical protein
MALWLFLLIITSPDADTDIQPATICQLSATQLADLTNQNFAIRGTIYKTKIYNSLTFGKFGIVQAFSSCIDNCAVGLGRMVPAEELGKYIPGQEIVLTNTEGLIVDSVVLRGAHIPVLTFLPQHILQSLSAWKVNIFKLAMKNSIEETPCDTYHSFFF